jgi:hypothetical protein
MRIEEQFIKVQHPEVGEILKKIAITYNDNNEEVFRNFVRQYANIDDLKADICERIDTKTREIIAQGFTFKGKTMSMSSNAQLNWTNVKDIPDTFFPKEFMSKNNEPVIVEAADKLNLWLLALNCSSQTQVSGTQLKIQVSNLATIDEVLNFIDPR